MLVAVSAASCLLFGQETKRAVGNGFCTIGESMSLKEAKKQALEEAYKDAIQQVVGVRVHSEETQSKGESGVSGSAESRLVESFAMLTRVSSSGKVIASRELLDTLEEQSSPGGRKVRVYHVSVDAQVATEQGSPDVSFQLVLELNKSAFQAGRNGESDEELVTIVRSSKDCYLTLFSVSDDSVKVLFPNDYMKDGRISADEQFEFPPKQFRESGLHIRPSLRPGTSHSSEAVIAVGTKAGVPFGGWEKEGGETGEVATYRAALVDLNRWLSGIPLDARAEAHALLEIQRR